MAKTKIKVITRTPSYGQLEEMLQAIVDDGHEIIAILPTKGIAIDIVTKAPTKKSR